MSRGKWFKFDLPALRVLENEHQYLACLMADWHAIVLSFERDMYTGDT